MQLLDRGDLEGKGQMQQQQGTSSRDSNSEGSIHRGLGVHLQAARHTTAKQHIQLKRVGRA
jgi:hypothetical protein